MKNTVLFWIVIFLCSDILSMPRGQRKHIKRLNAPHHWILERDHNVALLIRQELREQLELQENHSITQAPTRKKRIAQSHYDHQHNKIEHLHFVIQ